MQTSQPPLPSPTPSHSQCPLLPTLTYYKIRGISQPIRNILTYLKIHYKDSMINRKQSQLDKKNDMDNNLFDSGLPVYEDQFVKICNSIAIGMYVCQRYQKCQLLGSNLQTRAKVNQAMYKYSLDMAKIVPALLEAVIKTSPLENHTKTIFIQESLKKLIADSKFLNFCTKKIKITKNWVLDQLTIVDFYFYETCFYICGFFANYLKGVEELQCIQIYKDMAEKIFDGKEGGEGRQGRQRGQGQEARVFFLFKSQKMKEAIEKAWGGPKDKLFV